MSGMNYKIGVRIDEEIEVMLKELVEIEQAEAEKFERYPMNKSKLVIEAIKQYYATRVNRKVKNAYLDLIDDRITQQFQTYMIPQKQQMMDMYKDLKELSLQNCLIAKLIFETTESANDKWKIVKGLDNETVVEKAVQMKAAEIMKGKEKDEHKGIGKKNFWFGKNNSDR